VSVSYRLRHLYVIAAAALLSLGLDSCAIFVHVEPAVPELRAKALYYAREYLALGAEYDWGGQDDLPRTLYVDCSGLVINCYKYACGDYGYSLQFEDTTASGLRAYCDTLTQDQLLPGDLIFMGEGGVVNHVALFSKFEDGQLYFIDSTEKDDVTPAINGVTERSYPVDNEKFISFGVMRVRKPWL
jgi:hypothetical protein